VKNEIDNLFLKDIDLLFDESDPKLLRVNKNLSFKSINLRCYDESPYTYMTDFMNLLKVHDQHSSTLLESLTIKITRSWYPHVLEQLQNLKFLEMTKMTAEIVKDMPSIEDE
jgi:hypothetical protein